MNFMNSMKDNQLSAQVKKIEAEYRSEKAKSSKRRSCINYIAEKVCDSQYANNQLGGPNQIFAMSDIDLRDFIVENVYNQKREMAELVKDLQQLYQNEKNKKEELAKQLIEYQNKVEELEARLSNQNPLAAQAVNTGTGMSPFTVHSNFNDVQEENETIKVEEQEILVDGNQVFDVNQMRRKIDLYQEELIRVIGETGFSEAKQIFEITCERVGTSETTLKSKMNELEKLRMINKEEVSTFLRKRLALYSLSLLGEQIYKLITGQDPVVAEKDVLKRQHATLPHAYCIKDTATILEGLGYTNISIDSSANSIQVAGGHRYVPDIVADFSETEKTFWEVELAHHKDSTFFDKLNKAAKVTNTLYIISNDRNAFDKLKRQIGRYQADLLKKDISIKLTIFLGTMNQLKQRNIFTNPECKIKIG